MTAKTQNNAFEDALQMGVLKMLLADNFNGIQTYFGKFEKFLKKVAIFSGL